MELIIYAVPLSGVAALLFAFWRASWVSKQDAGSEVMQKIAGRIVQALGNMGPRL